MVPVSHVLNDFVYAVAHCFVASSCSGEVTGCVRCDRCHISSRSTQNVTVNILAALFCATTVDQASLPILALILVGSPPNPFAASSSYPTHSLLTVRLLRSSRRPSATFVSAASVFHTSQRQRKPQARTCSSHSKSYQRVDVNLPMAHRRSDPRFAVSEHPLFLSRCDAESTPEAQAESAS